MDHLQLSIWQGEVFHYNCRQYFFFQYSFVGQLKTDLKKTIILSFILTMQLSTNLPNSISQPTQDLSLVTIKIKLQGLSKNIAEVKQQSNRRRKARKEKLRQAKLELQRIIVQDKEQEQEKTLPVPISHFKKESLGGLVVQVPQNAQFHSAETNPYSPRNSIYLISELIKNYKDPQSAAREHLLSSLQILKNLEKSKMPPKAQIQDKMLQLEVKKGCQGLRTVVFDLDQTLIHCNQSTTMPYDIKINIKFPTGEAAEAGINIRPGAFQILHLLKGKFEVIIFTASHSCYANQILDYLDPKGELIHHRLYRQHCHLSGEGYFIKDLRILGRKMKDVLLVDNAAYSYAFQLDNGVPILPYFSGKQDFQLKMLGNYLLGLLREDELRRPNQTLFKLNRYSEFFGDVDGLVEQLYLE